MKREDYKAMALQHEPFLPLAGDYWTPLCHYSYLEVNSALYWGTAGAAFTRSESACNENWREQCFSEICAEQFILVAQ